MGKTFSGGIETSTGFKILNPSPIDDRLVVNLYQDLATLENIYIGIQVYVVDNSKYYKYNGTDWLDISTLFFLKDYTTIPAMLAAQATQINQIIYIVDDASADTSITFIPAETKRQAAYRYLGTATGSINDYLLLSVPYGNGGAPSASAFIELTDKATANIPTINIPLANALAAKADIVGGFVPQAQLPSYVDDVIEAYKSGNVFYQEVGLTTIIPAAVGKIYIDITSGQSNKQYRYSGSLYFQITNGLIASTTDVPEGTNLYFTVARVLATLLTGYTALANATAVVSTDTILQAIRKLQGQVSTALSVTFKSINGASIIGAGNIVTNVNLQQEIATSRKIKALDDQYLNIITGTSVTLTHDPATDLLPANFTALYLNKSLTDATFVLAATGYTIDFVSLVLKPGGKCVLIRQLGTNSLILKGNA